MRFRLFGRVYTISKFVYVGLILIVLVSVAAVGRVWMLSDEKKEAALLPTFSHSPAPTQIFIIPPSYTPTLAPLIAVYLTGEIKNPGVYWVEQGTILTRVVEMAGGLTPLAWAREINLALRVEDGMHVHVPRENESGGVLSSMKPGPSPTPGIVNINTANVETLMTLPGIGESTALDIIQYRTDRGGFSSIDDLMQVPGIKQARFDKIKGRITV